MKAYEVVVRVPNSHKDAKKTIFVQAESKKQLKEIDGVLKIHERQGVTLGECTHEIKYDGIFKKVNS